MTWNCEVYCLFKASFLLRLCGFKISPCKKDGMAKAAKASGAGRFVVGSGFRMNSR